jgi:hypothetical protein
MLRLLEAGESVVFFSFRTFNLRILKASKMTFHVGKFSYVSLKIARSR